MTSRPGGPKKVRLACRRCRTRRIKCDGQVPACGNCFKAGESCIDVDSRDGDLLLPRDFANTARARIIWLEGVIKEHFPDFDLTAGPQIDVPSDARTRSSTEDALDSSLQHGTIDLTTKAKSRKRTTQQVESSDEEGSFQKGAQSVAIDLGLLALNSDFPEKPYLGSSSGALFASLVQATSPGKSQESGPRVDTRGHAQSEASSQSRYRALHMILRQELPKQEDAMILVQTFVTEVQSDFPALDPQGLFSALKALYECSSLALDTGFAEGWPKSSSAFRWNGWKIDPAQNQAARAPMASIAFIMFMVFNIAAVVKIRTRMYEYPPEKFYKAALLFSSDCFSQVSLTSIQALVTIANHAILTPANYNLWTLVHVAMAHCIELGIHREPSQNDPSLHEAHQIQKMVFYTIYSLDRSISSIQGRPLGFRDETFDAEMPDEFLESDIVTSLPIASSFLTAIRQFARLQFRLDRLVSRIKVDLYHLPDESSQSFHVDAPLVKQQKIADDLQTWWQQVSSTTFLFSQNETTRGQAWILKLQTRYYNTLLLLYQPSQSIRKPTDEALLKCFSSASIILQNYQILRDRSQLHFGWRAVQNTFAAGATLVYVFWTSRYVQSRISATDLTKSLRTCSSLLSIGGEWWPAARRCKQSFETVVDLTTRKLFTLNFPKRPKIEPVSVMHASQDHPRQPSTAQNIESRVVRQLGFQPADSINPPMLSMQTVDMADWSSSSDARGSTNPQGLYSADLWSGQGSLPAFESNPEVVPEIQDFLADFDNSDFSWNFLLSGFDNSYDPDNLFSDGF